MKQDKIYSSYFLVPALLLYFCLIIVPCIMGFGYSLTNWNSMNDSVKFIGLENYKDIFYSQSPYLLSVIHTLEFAFFSAVFKALIGLALALLLNQAFKSQGLLRGVFFMPFAISPLIIGIIFTSILSPDGVFNLFLKTIGLGAITTSWLTNVHIALGSTIAVEVWRAVGLNMAIFLAGIQMIDKTYYEAANIDGARKWDTLIRITIPFLAPAITINTVLNIIHGLKVFDIIVALTDGGPGNTTAVINTNVFKTYSMGAYGLSTALSVVVFLLTAAIALATLKLIAPKEV
jgi:raffinose/stachyose/melibiose transport system permease protein